jgi:hypothetical protein
VPDYILRGVAEVLPLASSAKAVGPSPIEPASGGRP